MKSRLPHLPLLFLLPAALVVLAACQSTEPERRNFISTYRGMEKTTGPGGRTAMVKASDPSSLGRYQKVMVEPVRYIAPRNPNPKHKGPTREEARRLTSTFERTLREELGSHYELTNRRGRDTLAVRAALTELRPSEPALFILNYLPYAGAVTTGLSLATGETLGAGSTAMEAEVVDATSRRQVYAIVDRFKGGKLQPSGLEKWGQSEQAMRVWSRRIRKGIQKSTPSAPAARRAAATQASARQPAGSRQQTASATRRDVPKPAGQGQGPFAGLFKPKEGAVGAAAAKGTQRSAPKAQTKASSTKAGTPQTKAATKAATKSKGKGKGLFGGRKES